MTNEPVGPCQAWIDTDALSCETGDLSPEEVEQYIAAATEVLWALSGRRYGLCTETVRPCRRDLVSAVSGWHEWGTGWEPIRYGGEWFNVCGHSTGCSCAALSEVILPSSPAIVTVVEIDGEPLDESAYRVDEGRLLVRTDGGLWPACQDMAAPLGEPGTWGITFTWGIEVPQAGLLAVAELACELLKARLNKPCALPQRVTTITRQGVTMTLLDPQEFLRDGRVGLYFCDLWLETVNPRSQPMRSAVYNPDHFGVRRASG